MVLMRTNPNGLAFVISGHPSEELTRVQLRGSPKFIDINLNINNFNGLWWLWQIKGEYIQEVFKMLKPEEREFMMTGITPAEWNNIFKDKEEV